MNPDVEQIWLRVREYAQMCIDRGRSVFTVTQRVENRITDVKPGSIGRISDQGITNVSRVTRGMVANLWNELHGVPSGTYLYFTKALVLAALPDLVEDMDGKLVLRSDPAVLKEKRTRRAAAVTSTDVGGLGHGGGEGELHRSLKNFVYEQPDVALADLKSGPYQRVATEYVFATGDRVDVVLLDGKGAVVLVEVKPILPPKDPAAFAQAAKYRVLWSVLRDRPMEEVRCVVAAPSLAGSPWKRMRNKYGIESVAVSLPR